MIFIGNSLFAQNKSGNTVVIGIDCITANYIGDTAKPTIKKYFSTVGTNPYTYFAHGHSCISDSATGKPLFFCNGFQLFDTLGNLMENGDSLVPPYLYSFNLYPFSDRPQASIILPKGSNGEYYVFTVSNTDSYYNYLKIANTEYPYNLLQYHVVDIKANNGLGKVIKKNVPIAYNLKMSRVGMQACRHANGYDWWLLKQASYDSNYILRYLVKADTIIGPEVQAFPQIFTVGDLYGQSAFSKDGKHYAYCSSRKSKMFYADFDRCTGLLSNAKTIVLPVDSTTDPFYDNVGKFDSTATGVCFSSNDSFLYVSKEYNIYQLEIYNSNNAAAWYTVQHGCDTTLLYFENYNTLYRGMDGRIIIGNFHSIVNSCSMIENPNQKGVACGFCRKCMRYNSATPPITSPSNMPDFTLGVDSSSCWPVAIVNTKLKFENCIQIYPNPNNGNFIVEFSEKFIGQEFQVFDITGKLLLVRKAFQRNSITMSNYAKGIYLVKVANIVKRIIVE